MQQPDRAGGKVEDVDGVDGVPHVRQHEVGAAVDLRSLLRAALPSMGSALAAKTIVGEGPTSYR